MSLHILVVQIGQFWSKGGNQVMLIMSGSTLIIRNRLIKPKRRVPSLSSPFYLNGVAE